MKKVLMVLVLSFCLFVGQIKADEMANQAKSAILIDADTGTILFEKNSHEKMAPASMTKMMSMLLILEAIDNKIINWNDTITISENASSMGGSQILLETGEKMTVHDLFKGVAVASGNDAVVALAESVAGNVEEFVKNMNDKAKELGLKDSNFKNVHGLDEENHYSSAYDMAMIAKELAKHEEVFEFTSIYDDYLRKGTDREFWLVNTNKLIKFYSGADGLKTGYTKEAGYCLTATAKKSSMRLIATVMGEPTSAIRNAEVSSLLNYGFAQYKAFNVIKKGKKIKTINLSKAKNPNIEIVTKEEVSIVKKKTDKLGKISYETKINNINLKTKKDDTIGILKIKEDNKLIKEVPLTIKENIERCPFLELLIREIKKIIIGDIKI